MVIVVMEVMVVMLVRGQGGLGGLPGQRVSRTGDSWPPYPGAGLDIWACKAGFYGLSSDCSKLVAHVESFRKSAGKLKSRPPMILFW